MTLTRLPAAAVVLPLPRLDRWQPLRAGIVNIWHYEPAQEFRFDHGRLILHGRNGAGKTKALELLYPLLLDADLDPTRLAPSGAELRTMIHNLLEPDRDGHFTRASRVGFVWLEFGRRGADDAPVFLTLGARLQAAASTRKVNGTFFFTSQRVGEALLLADPAPDGTSHVPISRAVLEQRVGDAGAVFEQRAPYRRAVDERLFGLGRRFDGLVNLLLWMRKPKLSEKLDLATVRDYLTAALPPLAPEQVDPPIEAFEGLHRDREEIAALERALVGIDLVSAAHRAYATREAQARADRLRRAESSLDRAREETRAAAADADTQARQHAQTARRVEHLEQREIGLRNTLEALLGSTEMKAAGQLESATQAATSASARAGEDTAAAEIAAGHAAGLASLGAAAVGALPGFEGARDRAVVALGSAATAAAMSGPQARFVEDLDADPSAAWVQLAGAMDRRRQALERLDKTVSRRNAMADGLVRERKNVDAAKGRADQATSARESAGRAVGQSLEHLRSALAEWSGRAPILALDDEAPDALVARVAAGEHLASELAALAVEPRSALVEESTRLAEAGKGLARARAAVADERDLVASAMTIRPAENPARPAASRAERAGAPFYELVDFAPDLSPAERAGLEAALEGSTLLDAWVTPGGELLGPTILDASLGAGDPIKGPSLEAVLVPVAGAVDTATTEAVLRSIALGRAAAPAGSWLDLDGRFRIGPLAGHHEKSRSEFVGAGAREATRAARIGALDARIAAFDVEIETNRADRAGVEGRIRDLAAEIAAAPSDAPVAAARTNLANKTTAETERHDEHKRRARDLATREQALAALEADLATALATAGIEGGSAALAGAHGALAAFGIAAADARRTNEGLARARGDVTRTANEAAGALALAGQAADRAKASGAEARRLGLALRELERLVGADARAVVARRTKLDHAIRFVITALRGARHASEDAATAAALATTHHATLVEAEGRVLEERDRHALSFRAVAVHGLLSLALDDPALGDPTGWSTREAIETARRIDTANESAFRPEAINAAKTSLQERVRDLDRSIVTDYRIEIGIEPAEGFYLPMAELGDARMSVVALAATIRADVEDRIALASEKLRAAVTTYFLKGVAVDLGERIRQAHELVEGINAELARRPTASGHMIRLRWAIAPAAAPPGADRAAALLMLRPGDLNAADADTLVAFFNGQVEAARVSELAFREALSAALDYRTWHEFTIFESDGRRSWPLNKKTHQAGSGGEQSVSLHLPLFAAASAYFSSARVRQAPRLIALDEAFAGIDREMRGSIMGVMREFDFDFILTSPDEWGDYAALDGCASYLLARDVDGGRRGVVARHWTWTGNDLALDRSPSVAGL